MNWRFYSRQACYRSKIININWNQWDVRVFEIWYHNHKVWLLVKRYNTYKFSWKLIERIFVTCTLDCSADFNYLKFFSWSFLLGKTRFYLNAPKKKIMNNWSTKKCANSSVFSIFKKLPIISLHIYIKKMLLTWKRILLQSCQIIVHIISWDDA